MTARARLQRGKFAAILLLVLTLPLLAQQEPQKTVDAKSEAEARPEPLYSIQPNDVLEIFVWKNPDLTRKVLVRPDGRISFPLVQDLEAAGISPGELKDRIESRLKEYLTAPNVTVIVDAIQSYRVYVLGKVQKPGALTVEKPIMVLQALALAGGFQDFAKDSEITIIRNFGKENIVFEFNYRDVIKGKQPSQNILLRSGDVVVVP
jgi:polysaccharide export outer membrane protein